MPGFNLLPNPWGTIAYALLTAAGFLLVGGFVRGTYESTRLGRMAKHHELPQTVLLILLAVVLWRGGASGTPLDSAGALIAAGVLLGFVGDLFMAGALVKQDVLRGMAAFAIGHVLYIMAFRRYALVLGLAQLAPFVTCVLLMWIVTAVIWAWRVRGSEAPARLESAALVYGLLLASMTGVALGLAIQEGRFWPLGIGGLLFLLSDGLIAERMFAGRQSRYLGDAIWATYILAQALIVTAIAAAFSLL